MTATIVRRKVKSPKEPSLQDAAKAKASGERPPSVGQAPPKPSAVGDSYVQVLKHGLAEMLDAPADVLSGMTFDERRVAADFRANLAPTAEECSQAGEILASFRRWQREVQQHQARSVPGNGQAKEAADQHQEHQEHEGWDGLRQALRGNRPVPEDAVTAAATGVEIEIDVDRIQPHPQNRRSRDTDADVIELAESIKEDDQLQAIMVRPTPKAARAVNQEAEFEIIFGERRWRACRLSGRGSVRCRVRTDVDDVQALRLIAIENAKRQDLNPIERARLIETLCQPTAAGGAGMTREQAALCVGLKDGASASNLVRLLKLPEPWLSRVASGELEQSWARLLLPVLELAPVMEALENDWKRTSKANRPRYESTGFDSRSHLENAVEHFVRTCCRRLDEPRWHYDAGQVSVNLDKLTNQQRGDLKIVEVERPGKKKGQTETVAFATNAKYFDKLLDAVAAERAKRKAEKSGRDKKGEKPALSPAEKKQRAKELGEQLANRIAAWRHKLLRRACIQALDAGLDTGLRLVLAAAADSGYGTFSLHAAFEQLLRPERGYCRATQKVDYWPCVGALHDHGPAICANHVQNFLPALAQQFLANETSDWRRPNLAHSLVESYAAAIGVNLAQAWSKVQHDAPELVGEFFLLHQTAQLRELAGELGVHVPESATRAAMCKLLMSKLSGGSTFRYKLPQSIEPLPTGDGAKKRKRGAK